MATLEEMLVYSFGGNIARDYVFALGAFIISVLVLRIFKFAIIGRLKALSKITKTDLDDLAIEIIGKIGWPFYFLVSFYIGIKFIFVPDILTMLLDYAILIGIIYYAVKSVERVLDYATGKMAQKQLKDEKEADTSLIELLNKMGKGLVWAIALLLLLSNLGYDITTIIAGLGIGGIAIAFALQNVLTDIFASFTIYFDKPFRKGDYIVIGDDSGTVQKIGIKSTRIKTLQGEELVVSNRELTETRVRNFKKMKDRRIVLSVGVTYQTPVDKLKKIPSMVMGIIKKVKLADPSRVHFKEFGDSALIYEVVYFTRTNDYARYMDARQEINLEIATAFEKQGIDMAYPTQTIFMGKDAPKAKKRKKR